MWSLVSRLRARGKRCDRSGSAPIIGKLRGGARPDASGIILTAAGEEAQVDYGTGPMVRDPQSGKYKRTRLFVMTLGCSRKSVRLIVFRSSSQSTLQRRAGALRSGGDAVPCSRSRSQRESRVGRWPCAENTAEGTP